jgi:aminopeptidase N
MLSDGSELDRIDNLPTFGSAEQQQQQQQLQKQQLLDRDRLQAMQMAAADAAAQGRRQSLDRVSAWLRKPQSMVNLKESPKPEGKNLTAPAYNYTP